MKLKWTYELIVYIISKMNHEVKLIWFGFTIWDIYIIHAVASTFYSVHLKIIVWDASIHHILHSAGREHFTYLFGEQAPIQHECGHFTEVYQLMLLPRTKKSSFIHPYSCFAAVACHEQLWTSNMQKLAMAVLTSGMVLGVSLFLQSFFWFLFKQPVIGSTYIGIVCTGNLVACFMSYEKYMTLVKASQIPPQKMWWYHLWPMTRTEIGAINWNVTGIWDVCQIPRK